MTDHVDAETLAMFREGLLTADVAAVVGAHLDGCDRCGRAGSQLAMVSDLLATAPAPPMPPALSARIEAALAAEAAARAAASGPAAAEAEPAAAAERSGTLADRRRPATPQPAVSGPGAAPGGPGTGPGRRAGTGTGPGRPPQRARSRLARSRTRLGALAAAAAIVAVGGIGYAVSQLAAQSGPVAQSGSASAPRPAASRLGAPAAGMEPASPAPAGNMGPRLISTVASGTNYLAGQLSSQLQAVLQQYPAGSAQRWPAGGWRGLPATGIAACVNAVTHGQHPRLVDIARYQGKPAMVIVVAGHGTAPARAWVVAPDCTAARPDVLARTALRHQG